MPRNRLASVLFPTEIPTLPLSRVRLRINSIRVSIVLVALFAASPIIRADSYLVAGVSSSAYTNSQGSSYPKTLTPFTVAPLAETGGFSDAVSSGSASGSVSGSVAFGSISGSASGTAESSTILADSFDPIDGEGSFAGVWADTLDVTSATLSVGTPVNLLFTLDYAATLSCSGTANVLAAIGFTASAGGAAIQEADGTCNSILSGTQSIVVATVVGSELNVAGTLNLEAQAVAVTNGGESTASVDPPSAAFYIDSETAGATYTTGSGYTYFSPVASAVPEPPSIVMLLLGLFCLAAAATRLNKLKPRLA